MRRVEKRCRKLIPVDSGGQFAVVKSKLRAWNKRDDIEARIVRLRETVRGCYERFLVCLVICVVFVHVLSHINQIFTTSRTEHTSNRIENTILVQGTENHVRLNRLEVLVTEMLLTSKFGQQCIEQLGIRLADVRSSFFIWNSLQSLDEFFIRTSVTRLSNTSISRYKSRVLSSLSNIYP